MVLDFFFEAKERHNLFWGQFIRTMKNNLVLKKVLFLNSYAAYKGIDVDEGVEFLRKFGVEVESYKN